jgi:hypothetical protein
MNTQRKNSYFVSGLLFAVMVLASINLFSCGGSNSAPVLYSISPGSTNAPSASGTPATSSVTLIGGNFGTSQGTSSNVLFNNVVTAASVWSDTTIVATVPILGGTLTPGTSVTVPVIVSVGGQVSNAVTFVYNVTP